MFLPRSALQSLRQGQADRQLHLQRDERSQGFKVSLQSPLFDKEPSGSLIGLVWYRHTSPGMRQATTASSESAPVAGTSYRPSTSDDWLTADLQCQLGSAMTDSAAPGQSNASVVPASASVGPVRPPTPVGGRPASHLATVQPQVQQHPQASPPPARAPVPAAQENPRHDKSSKLSSSSDEDDDRVQARGTLTIGEDGRARYIGPTGGSEWLQEVRESSGGIAVGCVLIPTTFHRPMTTNSQPRSTLLPLFDAATGTTR
jgi:hypothetical protein